jgi:hypothetical protein
MIFVRRYFSSVGFLIVLSVMKPPCRTGMLLVLEIMVQGEPTTVSRIPCGCSCWEKQAQIVGCCSLVLLLACCCCCCCYLVLQPKSVVVVAFGKIPKFAKDSTTYLYERTKYYKQTPDPRHRTESGLDRILPLHIFWIPSSLFYLYPSSNTLLFMPIRFPFFFILNISTSIIIRFHLSPYILQLTIQFKFLARP